MFFRPIYTKANDEGSISNTSHFSTLSLLSLWNTFCFSLSGNHQTARQHRRGNRESCWILSYQAWKNNQKTDKATSAKWYLAWQSEGRTRFRILYRQRYSILFRGKIGDTGGYDPEAFPVRAVLIAAGIMVILFKISGFDGYPIPFQIAYAEVAEFQGSDISCA